MRWRRQTRILLRYRWPVLPRTEQAFKKGPPPLSAAGSSLGNSCELEVLIPNFVPASIAIPVHSSALPPHPGRYASDENLKALGHLAPVLDGPTTLEQRFGGLPLSDFVARALRVMGYTTPTPIQQDALPPLLAGRDVVGRAQTGTGKTIAFGIPLVELLDPGRKETQGIILTPTRELAMQVAEEIRRVARFSPLRIVTVYGGQPIGRQLAELRHGAHIVVGTPGRVLDHIGRGSLDLSRVRLAVLDEADQMLDVGFAEDIARILRLTPSGRQTALFSATMPLPIRHLVARHLRNPHWVEIGPPMAPVATIEQIYYEVASEDRLLGLTEVLHERAENDKVLVFRRTQRGVDHLTRLLQRQGFRCEAIHGGLQQNQRDAVLGAFRTGSLRVLVATNVAARGLDISEVSHVVNYDMPATAEEYLHRIGRTARVGRSGTAISFVTEDDFTILDGLKEKMGEKLIRARLALYTRG